MDPPETCDSKKGGTVSDFTGLAIQVSGKPWTWTGSDFANLPNSDSFILHLDNGDISEIEEALSGFKGSTFPYDQLTSTSLLPTTLSSPLGC